MLETIRTGFAMIIAVWAAAKMANASDRKDLTDLIFWGFATTLSTLIYLTCVIIDVIEG